MRRIAFCLFSLTLVLLSCNREPAVKRTDTMSSGVAKVAIDETCLPFMREEVGVFESLYEESDIQEVYLSDEDAINLLMKDSLRLAVAARDFTQAEKDRLKENKLLSRSNVIAKDAIALIIHGNRKDTLMGIPTLKKILTGAVTNWNEIRPGSNLGKIQVVFDKPTSSTVRFLQETVCDNEDFGNDIKAVPSSEEVIDFVSNTPGALGVIGVSWVSDPTDTLSLKFIDRIRVMAVSPFEDAREDNSYLPQAAWIAMGNYPLTRSIYILTSDAPGHLPSGFMNFVGGEKGQRLILKSGIVPANRPMRLVSMKPE